VGPSRAATGLAVAAIAPLLLTFLGSAWVVLGWVADASPFWPDPQMTLSEAAGIGNAGEVVRLITAERHDPNLAWPVREGILGPAEIVTPLEAAVAVRRTELVPVLVRHGAAVPRSGPARVALVCRAVAAAAAPEMVEMLTKMTGGSSVSCGQPEN
jgi:hypothetical protein